MLNPEPNMNYLGVKEAAGMLHVHENTLRRWCDSGKIPGYRIGKRGDRRFLKADLEILNNQNQ